MLFKTHFAPAPVVYRSGKSTETVCADALAGLRALLEKHADAIAAVSIEPLVMGAAGMIVHPPGYLAGVRALCDEFDVLLIADEVAVGFGRTGNMFACEYEAVTPDLLCLGKGITGGYLPLAATLTTQTIFDAFLGEPWEGKTFFHGHTYTGNPLAAAAAIASLELFEEKKLLQHVRQTSAIVAPELASLRELPIVGDVRQCGFMVGVELVADPVLASPFDPKLRIGAGVCQRLRQHGVLLRPLGDTIVINPPLVTTADEWRVIVNALRQEILAKADTLTSAAAVTERGDEQVAGDY